jgi:MYXO-CTERM domain-containing protein
MLASATALGLVLLSDLAAPAGRILEVPHRDVITTDQRPRHLGEKIIYVNFDGGNMGFCNPSRPQDNCNIIFGGNVLPFSGDAARRAAIVQLLRRRLDAYGVTVTTQRPESGDYDMEMVGDLLNYDPPWAGVAPTGDCWDNYGGEISFTTEASGTSDGMAEVILQELAHSWGLDHVESQSDLLYPTTQGQGKTFTDQCLAIVELEGNGSLTPTTGDCSHHVEACGSNALQNSHQELLLIFGPSVPDTAAPTVEVLSPADGDKIEGDGFDLVVNLQDDQIPAVIGLTITIEGAALPEPIADDGAFASPGELRFPISGLDPGQYTVTVAGVDESENPASDAVTVTIADPNAPDTEGSGSGGDASTGDDTDGSGAADDDDAAGCACAAAPAPSLPWALGLLALVRRRIPRRRTAC